MKILHIIQKVQLRGAEVFAAQLSNHMINNGHEVMIVSLKKGNAELPFDGKIISLDADLKKKFFDWGAWKRLAKIIRDFEPDIVQANAGDTLKYAVFSKKIFRWKQPVFFRNASMVSNYISGRVSKLITSFFFKHTDHIIAVSQYTKNDLVKHFGLASKDITVLPVGIDLKQYKRVSLFDDKLINFVHVGGFSFEKNHERLLYMFRELFLKDKRFRLWLIGDGPLLNKIKALAKEIEVNDYVFFKGFTANPLDYIYSSDILLLPSKIEGLPAVILEAFYCKTPVVAYNVGGISQLVKNNHTGWLVEPGDETGFIECVSKISHAGKDEIHAITDNAYNEVITHYSNKQIAVACVNIYEQVKKDYPYHEN